MQLRQAGLVLLASFVLLLGGCDDGAGEEQRSAHRAGRTPTVAAATATATEAEQQSADQGGQTPTVAADAAAMNGKASPTVLPDASIGTTFRRYETPATYPEPQSLPVMNCWTGSLSTRRADAFRCSTEESFLYDPCFLNSEAMVVACPEDPREEETVVFARWSSDWGGPAEVRGEIGWPERPWFLVVDAPGEPSCRFLTGATMELPRGARMDFGCGVAACASPFQTDTGALALLCYPGIRFGSSEEEMLAVETVYAVKEAWY